MTKTEIFAWFMATILLATCLFQVHLLYSISEQNKQAQQVFLCFDYQGNVTNNDDFKECKNVRVHNED